jgi:hypothetical protein
MLFTCIPYTFQIEQWFSNGAPQEVAKCTANIMKVYFENEKKPICIQIYYIHDLIFIHSLKYINIFLIVYTKCARNFLYVQQCAANQKSLRTTEIEYKTKTPRMIHILM